MLVLRLIHTPVCGDCFFPPGPINIRIYLGFPNPKIIRKNQFICLEIFVDFNIFKYLRYKFSKYSMNETMNVLVAQSIFFYLSRNKLYNSLCLDGLSLGLKHISSSHIISKKKGICNEFHMKILFNNKRNILCNEYI